MNTTYDPRDVDLFDYFGITTDAQEDSEHFDLFKYFGFDEENELEVQTGYGRAPPENTSTLWRPI